MTPARLVVVLVVIISAIVGISLVSSQKRGESLVRTPITVPKQGKHDVVVSLESSNQLPPPASLESGLRPANSWKFSGNTTPKATFESVFWAKEYLESPVLASLLSVSPEIRLQADQVLSSMSLTARSRLAVHTPEALIAYLYATSPVIRAFRIVAEHERDSQHSIITGELQLENSRKAVVDLGFRLEAGGWKYVLDERNAREMLDNWQRVWKDHEK